MICSSLCLGVWPDSFKRRKCFFYMGYYSRPKCCCCQKKTTKRNKLEAKRQKNSLSIRELLTCETEIYTSYWFHNMLFATTHCKEMQQQSKTCKHNTNLYASTKEEHHQHNHREGMAESVYNWEHQSASADLVGVWRRTKTLSLYWSRWPKHFTMSAMNLSLI